VLPAERETRRARWLAIGRKATLERIAELSRLSLSTIQRVLGPRPSRIRASATTLALIDMALDELESEQEANEFARR